jgi:hypothetical protein
VGVRRALRFSCTLRANARMVCEGAVDPVPRSSRPFGGLVDGRCVFSYAMYAPTMPSTPSAAKTVNEWFLAYIAIAGFRSTWRFAVC